jgi:CRP/FNR family transcriptional regulator, cyclic AMP receptor protein
MPQAEANGGHRAYDPAGPRAASSGTRTIVAGALALLQRSPVLSAIPSRDLEHLASRCRVVELGAGEIVLRAESPQTAVCYLAGGKLMLYRRHRDITLLLGIIESPSIFGDAECAGGVPWMVSARTESPCACVFIPNEDFLACVKTHASVAFQLYQDASVRHLLANFTAQTMALYDIETRLLRLLLEYARAFGRIEGKAAVIEKRVTVVELAEALGVTRKTIDRTLKPLEKRGLISRRKTPPFLSIDDVDAVEASLPKNLLGMSSRLGRFTVRLLDRGPTPSAGRGRATPSA